MFGFEHPFHYPILNIMQAYQANSRVYGMYA
jgi:hypothetical protein